MKKLLFYILMIFFISHSCFADITLAIIAPKTGEYAKEGAELFEGARLAAEELNDQGGINGQKIDLLTIDDRCDDRLALSTAQMLTLLKSKTIGLVVGPYCSNRYNEISEIYENAKIFQIVPTTEAYDRGNTNKKGNLLFLGTKEQMSRDFFNFYNNNYAGLNVGFVYDGKKETGYNDVAKSLYDEFRHNGKINLLKFYTLNEEVKDIDDTVETLISDDVHIIFTLGEKEEVSELIYEAKSKDKNMIIFTNKKILPKKELEDLGKKANGLYLIDLPSLKDSLMFTESLVDLRLLGVEPKGLETYSYVAIKLWGDLAKKVKTFNYQRLLSAANDPALKEKWGEFLMHSGSISSAKYIIEQYHKGAFKQVY